MYTRSNTATATTNVAWTGLAELKYKQSNDLTPEMAINDNQNDTVKEDTGTSRPKRVRAVVYIMVPGTLLPTAYCRLFKQAPQAFASPWPTLLLPTNLQLSA